MSDEKHIHFSNLTVSELNQKLAFEFAEKEEIRHNFEETKKEWIEEKKQITDILKDREIELKQANERLQLYFQKIEELNVMLEEIEKQKMTLLKRNEELYKDIQKMRQYSLANRVSMQKKLEKVLESVKELKEWRKFICKEVEGYTLWKEEKKDNEEIIWQAFKKVEEKEKNNKLVLKKEKEEIIADTNQRNKDLYMKISALKEQIKNFRKDSLQKADENIKGLQNNTMKDLEHLNQLIMKFCGVFQENKQTLEEFMIKFDQLANTIENDNDFKNIEIENQGMIDIIRKIELLFIFKNKNLQILYEKEIQSKKENEEKFKKIDSDHKLEINSIKIKHENDLKSQLDVHFNKLNEVNKKKEELINRIQDYELEKIDFQLEKQSLTTEIDKAKNSIDNLKEELNKIANLNQKLNDQLITKNNEIENLIKKIQDLESTNKETSLKMQVLHKEELMNKIQDYELKKMDFELEKQSLTAEIDKSKNNIGILKEELNNNVNLNQKLNDQLTTKNNEIENLIKKINDLESTNNEICLKMQVLHKEELMDKIQDYELKKIDFELEKQSLTTEIDKSKNNIDILKEQLNNSVNLNQKLNDQLTTKNDEIENLIKKINDLESTNNEICLKMQLLQEELNRLSLDTHNKDQIIDDLNHQLEAQKLKNQQYQKNIDELKFSIETLNKEATELKKELQLKKELEKMNEDHVISLNSKINDFESLFKKIEEEDVNTHKLLESQVNDLKQLYQEKKELLIKCDQNKEDLDENQTEINNLKYIIEDLNIKLGENYQYLTKKALELELAQQKLMQLQVESDQLKNYNEEIRNLLEKSKNEIKALKLEKEEANINLKKTELAFLQEKEKIIIKNETDHTSLINTIRKQEDLIKTLNQKLDLFQTKEKDIEMQLLERNKELGSLFGLVQTFKKIIIKSRKEIPILKDQIKLIKAELNNFSLYNILNPQNLFSDITSLFEKLKAKEMLTNTKLKNVPDKNIGMLEVANKDVEISQLLTRKYRSLFESMVEKLIKEADLNEETRKLLVKQIYKTDLNFDDRPADDLTSIIDGLLNLLKETYGKKIVEEEKENLNESFFISEENQHIVQLEEQLSIIKFENSHVGKKYQDILQKYYTDLKKYKNSFISFKSLYEQDKILIKENSEKLNKIKECLDIERDHRTQKFLSLKNKVTDLKYSLLNLNFGESLKSIEFNQLFTNETITSLLKEYNSKRYSNIFQSLTTMFSSQIQKLEKELLDKIDEGFLKLENIKNLITSKKPAIATQPSDFLNVLGSAINHNQLVAREGKGLELNVCLDYGRRENLITREQLENLKNWNKISLMRLQTINLNFAQILKSLLFIPSNMNQEHERVANCFMNVVSFLEEYERKIKEFDANDREGIDKNETVPNFTESVMLLNSFIKGLFDMQGFFI